MISNEEDVILSLNKIRDCAIAISDKAIFSVGGYNEDRYIIPADCMVELRQALMDHLQKRHQLRG